MEIISFRFQDFLSAFIILFAVIDITGLTPIIIDMKQKGQNIIAWKAAVYSLVTFLAFLFMGNMILNLFQVDISSFAIAGALVIFVMAIEMLLGVEIFRNDGPEGAASIVPIVFPLIAGAGSFTTLLSLRALYGLGSILAALFLNILVIYVVIRNVHILENGGLCIAQVLRYYFIGTFGSHVFAESFHCSRIILIHTDYIFEKRGGDFVTPLFMRYVDGIAGHIVSIIDPTEVITVVDMSRLVAGVYLVRTGDKVVRLVKL